MTAPSIPEPYRTRALAIANRFAQVPSVVAVTLAGSLTAGQVDEHSDLDIYVYSATPIPLAERRQIAAEFAGPDDPRVEIGKPYWGDEDAWIDRASDLGVDLIYWSPEWIAGQIARCLVEHQAWLGYTTSFWYTIKHSAALFDRDGWFADLQTRADQPYPAELRQAIVTLNWPVLRQIGSSYTHQIELAIARRDRVSLNHRITALLASYFDIIFAANWALNPGEKRVITQVRRLCNSLPEDLVQHVEALIVSSGALWEEMPTLAILDRMLDNLEGLLEVEGLITLD